MTLGKNPFEVEEPLEEKPPVRRRPVTPAVIQRPPLPEAEGLPQIPPEGIPYTVKDEEGKDINLNILEDFEFVGTERRLRSEDYIVFHEGKEVGKYLRKTGTFEAYEPTWWEKTLGITGKALEWLFVLPSFVGSSIGYLGEELKKRWDMSDEEWEAYKKAGLPVASIGDIKKFLPGGEFHKRLQQTPFFTRLALEAPFWVGAAIGGVSALKAREAAKALPAVLRVPTRAVLAPAAGVEKAVGFTLQQTIGRVANKVFIKVSEVATKRQLRTTSQSLGIKLTKETEVALYQSYKKAFSRHLDAELRAWATLRGRDIPVEVEGKLITYLITRASPKWAARQMLTALGKTPVTPTLIGTVSDVTAKSAVAIIPKLLDDWIKPSTAIAKVPIAVTPPTVPTTAPLITPPPTAVPEVTTRITSAETFEYWNSNLEINPLRKHQATSDVGATNASAFLSNHLEGAGDILREFNKAQPDRNYIFEKFNRYKNNFVFSDWTDPLSATDKEAVAKTRALVEAMPVEGEFHQFLKEYMLDTLDRNKSALQSKLPRFRELITENLAKAEEIVKPPAVEVPAVAEVKPFETTQSELETRLPEVQVGDTVSGLVIRKDIPNVESISATFDEWSEIKGVREIKLSEFQDITPPTRISKDTQALIDAIRESGEINPLIVVFDKDGFYILEGANRFDALVAMGIESFPAAIVLDDVSLFDAAKKVIEEGGVVPQRVLDEYPQLKEIKPTAVEVTKPPVEPLTPHEPVVAPVEGVTEILASTEQKALAHTLAKDKALINEAGKTRQQYRRLAENITGKKSMKDMTKEEASAFIDALEKYPDKKWSAKTGTWIPQPIPITKALVPENYFNIKFGEPTPIKFFTSQNFYATKLGVGELTRPLELAKQRLDLEYPAWTKAVDVKIKDLNKAYKVTISEKLIAVRNNIPTRAVSDMAKLLNKYEDLPPDVAARLGEDKVKLFSWFRNVDRTILAGENKVRELLNMPLIPHRKAYLRHIADRTANEIMQGNFSLPQDLAYWSKQIVGKKIFNPMSIQRKLSDDLLEHFSKDLNYITKSMIWTGLKEIHLSQPLQAFTAQLNVLSKGNMPFSSLTSEELLRAQAVSTLPASTRKWLVDYVNQVIKGQQTELDASVNRIITQTGIGGVLDKLLKEFGRSIGTRPVTVMAQFAGRINILATIGTKPRQIIRNLFQTTQNLAIYGVVPTLQAELPAGKTLTRLLNNSLFLKSYARYEELPTSAMGKVEAAWMWAYGKSAIINARKGMKAAFYPTVDYITNPKNKGLGWADPQRTYTEEKGFLYPSEEENLLREMEYGAGATQYQYIAMGMPEIFRHKVLTPITRLQSWWMNYFAKFHREALHRFWTGSVGWNPNLKLPPSARLNWFKYIILGGAVLTAMGYKKSFMKDVLPHWGSPAVQFATGAYNYVIADSDYARKQAELAMSYSISAFVPGMIDYKSWKAVWTGEKPMDSLFFYGEGWEPEMPTWGIPILEEANEIKKQINYVKDEVPTFKRLLGTQIPSEDDIEEYTYEMSDFASEIRALIRDIPDDRITELSDITQMYKRAETMWDANYYSLPSSDRQEWLQRDTPESIWTGAYLALWGKLKVTGWVSGNSQTIELIRKLVDDFNIPSEAIPSLGELKEGAKDTRKRRPLTPRTTKTTEPSRSTSGSLGVNPFE